MVRSKLTTYVPLPNGKWPDGPKTSVELNGKKQAQEITLICNKVERVATESHLKVFPHSPYSCPAEAEMIENLPLPEKGCF